MQPHNRRKPQRNHVRTGCTTCKQRRVKCTEERPHCSRCIRGGFICAGYTVSTAWIFKSSAAMQTEVNNRPSDSSSDSLSTSCSIPITAPRSDSGNTPISSPLQLGNSDPFNTLPVPFGPHETYLLRIYQALVEMRFTTYGSRHTIYLPAAADRSQYDICFVDEAVAYSLLARNAVMHHLRLNGRHAAPSTALINSITMTQAALHRKLALLSGFETPEVVCAIMWASGILALIDMLMDSPSTHLHSRAMSKMIVRYVELIGDDVRLEPILYFLYADTVRALLTMTRPMVDMIDWFPRLCQKMWNEAAAHYPSRKSAVSNNHIHHDVKDAVIQEIILNEREGGTRHLDLQDVDMDSVDPILVANTVRSQEVWRYGQVLNIAIDAMECLERADSMPRNVPEQIHDQTARVYIPVSILLWMTLTSPTSFASNGGIDTIPGLLKHLRIAIIKSKSHQNKTSHQEEPYAVAKLWVLFVGVHTECQHRDIFNADLLYGVWFFDAFREQAESMGIRSWQHSVTFLRQILYSDDLIPHISEWWHHVFPNAKSRDIFPAPRKSKLGIRPSKPPPDGLFRLPGS